MSIEAIGETTPRTSRNSTENGAQLQVFLTRGLVAIAWAAVFAATADSLTVGVGILLVIYPLIDVVGSLIDARTGSRNQASRKSPVLATPSSVLTPGS